MDLAETHSYDIHFEDLKRYLFTRAEAPSLIPVTRKDFLLNLYQIMKATERQISFGFVYSNLFWDTFIGLVVSVLLLPFGGTYLAGVVTFALWIFLRVLLILLHVWNTQLLNAPVVDVDAIYEETERLIASNIHQH